MVNEGLARCPAFSWKRWERGSVVTPVPGENNPSVCLERPRSNHHGIRNADWHDAA